MVEKRLQCPTDGRWIRIQFPTLICVALGESDLTQRYQTQWTNFVALFDWEMLLMQYHEGYTLFLSGSAIAQTDHSEGQAGWNELSPFTCGMDTELIKCLPYWNDKWTGDWVKDGGVLYNCTGSLYS